MRGSLLDDVGYESIGTGKRKPGSPRGRGHRVKTILALVLFLGAAGLVGWNFGAFSRARVAPRVLTMEDEANIKANDAVRAEIAKRPGTTINGN